MFDAPDDPDNESTYECMNCGEIVTDDSHPISCPDCGSSMQNRANSLK